MTDSTSYQIAAIPFTHVKIEDSFWAPRIETNHQVTVKYDFRKCEETGRILNFAKAGGKHDGDHEGIFFNDSDVFKVIEGASYTLMQTPDPELDVYLDQLIDLIAIAQEPDGYLYTARTIAERNNTPDSLSVDREGPTRYSNLRVSHELYNVGHMYEAATAHYLATGKRSLLNVALRSVDHVDSVFGPGKLRAVPGHQEIELGLIALYRVTGESRYLQLAKFFLDERGQADGHTLYGSYAQDHLPVTDQKEAVGHAVRAVYMYAAMADVAVLTGDNRTIHAIDTIWEDVVTRKIYITGGIGARHEGESFGDPYELPSATAYNETCAAIANIFWNLRLFQLHGHAKYMDVLERSLYNGFLSGIDFSGDRFFYVNPLEFDGVHRFNRDNSLTRMPWFNCSCCPTNVVRLFPALGGYVYGQQGSNVYVNLFVASTAMVEVEGTEVKIRQSSLYPWDGKVVVNVAPSSPVRFALRIRIPGWARGNPLPGTLYRYHNGEGDERPVLSLNGQSLPLQIEKGYAIVERVWQEDDEVELELPMPVHRVVSDPQITTNRGLVSIERGPLVYCLEAIDNDGKALGRTLSDLVQFAVEWQPDLLEGINIIRASQDVGDLVFVPYYAWAHRGVGEMTVWVQRTS